MTLPITFIMLYYNCADCATPLSVEAKFISALYERSDVWSTVNMFVSRLVGLKFNLLSGHKPIGGWAERTREGRQGWTSVR